MVEITVIENMLMADLVADLPQAVRLQNLVSTLRTQFCCGAVALLRLEEAYLRPIAVDGLVRDALGRRFAMSQHPRLAAILSRHDVTCFDHDSTLPDPYDGLIENRVGEPLPVHDCMGVSLHVEGQPWGVITLDALQVGAFDQAARDCLRQYSALIEASIRMTRLEAEIRALRIAHDGKAIAPSSHEDDGEIVGQSQAITQLLRELEVVADSELPVLLLGETGVGKELFAHRVHRLSRRRAQALVQVNCAALPESLAESELFGHAKGTFSGATGERPGRFEAADEGTLFLDEVGELPLSVQAKLLRTLQSGEIQRLGEDRPRHVNVRVIAATNRNLRDRVRDGGFRADLYHRLSVYPVHIPPLRERDNDVLLLAGRFLELNRARLGLRSLRLAPQAEVALRRYPWPGNVRELEHVISRAALKIVSRGVNSNDIITLPAELLDLDETELHADSSFTSQVPAAELEGGASLRDAVEACQRNYIREMLDRCDGNWAMAARRLDLDASNLHKLARRLGLKRRDSRSG